MKLGGREINLSNIRQGLAQATKVDKPNATGDEQGSAGTSNLDYFLSERGLGSTRNPGIKQIMEMLDNDGTAQGLYNIITFPVLAAGWHLQPHPKDIKVVGKDDNGNETVEHPQADFIENALRAPQHEGGMSTPFSLVLADISLGIAQGYRCFEMVYKINDNEQLVFQKIIARDPYEITIETDDTGGFNGFSQQVTRNGKTVKVHIELPYAFLFTHRKERNFLKGKSALRTAFYHYDKKHRLYWLANQQAQQAAIQNKKVKSPENSTKEQRDDNLKAVDAMATRSTVALPYGWDVEALGTLAGLDLSKYIDHHDVAMARSVLAQLLMLGTQSDSKGGSFALSSNHADLFMLGEKTLMSSIEEHLTAYVVSKLAMYNFATPLYPTFKFNDLTNDMMELLKEAFKGLVSKGQVPDWVRDGISARVAKQLDITEPKQDLNSDAKAKMAEVEDAIQQKALNGGQVQSLLEVVAQVVSGDLPQDTAGAIIKATFPVLTDEQVAEIMKPLKDFEPTSKPAAKPANTPPADTPPTDTPPVENSRKKKDKFDSGEWWRELTAPEAKVNFSKIQDQADTAEQKMQDAMKTALDKMRDDTVARLKPLLEDKGVKATDGFELDHTADLEKAYTDTMNSTYTESKKVAADELKVGAPADSTDSKALLQQHAQSIVEKQASDLLFEVKTAVTQAGRKNQLAKTELSIDDVLNTIAASFDDFFKNKGEITTSALVSTSMNVGRDDVFKANEDAIYGYQYSAILDNAVCPICKDLDGSIVTPAEYLDTKWMPPIHFNCRCIWVAILEGEEDKPDFTGFPSAPGGVTEPLLSADKSWKGAIYLSEELQQIWLTRRK